MGRHHHLRGARQRPDAAARGRAEGIARHLSRARRAGDDRAPAQARRHRDRAAADPFLRRRAAPARARAEELLGLQHAELLRARAALRRRQHPERVPLDASPSCTAPASRSSSTWSTTTPPRAIISARRCAIAASTTPSYYWLVPDKPRFYENYTGTGNALKLDASARAADGDGLAALLGRGVPRRRLPLRSRHARSAARRRSIRTSAFFAAVRQDPVLANVKLIAEPWDIGLGGYQVGGFPPGWSEWNDIYRKTLRRYWRGDGGLLGDLAGALTGSAAQFRHDGRGPRASVNHVTVHDGFTLADLVSYEHKHNEANGEDNRDGSDDNNSLNCGVEGPTDDPADPRTAAPAAPQSAGVAAARAGRAADPGRRRGRQQPGRQQQRLLPGQRDRLGGLVGARQRRRHDRVRRRPDAAAPALSATALAALARGQQGRRHARRAVAPARRRPRCRTRTGISRRALPRLCARRRRATAASRCSSCSTPRRKASKSRCRPGRTSRAGRRVLDTAGNSVLAGADQRRAGRQAHRAAAFDHWPSRASHDRGRPLRPADRAGRRHLSALGAGARRRVDAGADDSCTRCSERTTAGSS